MPLPDFSQKPPAAPQLPKASLTSPKPFKLATETRGAIAKEKFEHQVEEEMEKANQARMFKAKPIILDEFMGVANVIRKKLCSPAPFKLASVERSLQARKLFEDRLAHELEQAAEVISFLLFHD